MKRLSLFFIVVVPVFFVVGSCAKKKNEKLAKNYYQMSVLELSHDIDSDETEQLACRRALNFIDKAIEQDDKPEYCAFKATLLFKLKHFDESNDFFKVALAKQSNQALRGEVLNNYACLLAQQGKIDESFVIWRALEVDPYYATPEVAFFNEGKALASLGDYAKAKTCFLKATTFAPGYLDAQYFLALAALKCGDTALAKNSIGSVLYLHPEHEGAVNLAQKLGISMEGATQGLGERFGETRG